MLKLYRGLVDILTERCEGLNNAFSAHIRTFNSGDTETNNFGVSGFWNLLLEIVFVMYVKMFVAVGIVLTVCLAILFFPLYALGVATSNVLSHRAAPHFEEPNYIEPVEKK